MCKLLKETLKSGRKKNPQFGEGSKSENSWKYEVYFLPNYLINCTCVYIYTTGKALKRPRPCLND